MISLFLFSIQNLTLDLLKPDIFGEVTERDNENL